MYSPSWHPTRCTQFIAVRRVHLQHHACILPGNADRRVHLQCLEVQSRLAFRLMQQEVEGFAKLMKKDSYEPGRGHDIQYCRMVILASPNVLMHTEQILAKAILCPSTSAKFLPTPLQDTPEKAASKAYQPASSGNKSTHSCTTYSLITTESLGKA